MSKMKVLKILISGKMPEACEECDYLGGEHWALHEENWCEAIVDNTRDLQDANRRYILNDIVNNHLKPNWCPLVKEVDGKYEKLYLCEYCGLQMYPELIEGYLHCSECGEPLFKKD